MPYARICGLGALALFLAACSPTDVDPNPELSGPAEVHGAWEDSQLVCSIPLTIDAAHPLRVVRGDVRLVFPAVGTPKAEVETSFGEAEMEAFWGRDLEGATTRSLRTIPTVQDEDYEGTVTFAYRWETPSGEVRGGDLAHRFHCVESPEEGS